MGFPSGSVVKNPPACAEDTGSIPDWAKSTALSGGAAKQVPQPCKASAVEPGNLSCFGHGSNYGMCT